MLRKKQQKKQTNIMMRLTSVGLKDIVHPIRIRNKAGGLQETVADLGLRATMPRQGRESCVGVLVAALNRYQADMSAAIFPKLLAEVRRDLEAESATLEMAFPFFLAKAAPVTGTTSLMEYRCQFTGTSGAGSDLFLTVRVPVTTLCPCSKEISSAGAHNQRALIELCVRPRRFLWLEDLITLAESCGSCEVYALLKRPDEKHVTEAAYRNPMFVEDVVRQVAQRALAHPDITWFSVGVESFESIHNHSAYAYLDADGLREGDQAQ